MRPTTHAALIIMLAAILLPMLAACGTPPTREQRMKSPQTAMRGPAYKRLIQTFNEAHNLAVKSSDYAARIESEGGDPNLVLQAQELADDSAKFADDIEWFLTNRRRMQWHQVHMNRLWERYDALDEAHRETILAYTDRSVRRPTLLIKLKLEYRDRYGVERPEPRWGDLFYPVGAKNYPRNPWND